MVFGFSGLFYDFYIVLFCPETFLLFGIRKVEKWKRYKVDKFLNEIRKEEKQKSSGSAIEK